MTALKALGRRKTRHPNPAEELADIPLEQIKPSPDNYRDATRDLEGLAAAIKAVGLEQRLVVRKKGQVKNLSYEIVDGERRYRAIKLLGWKTAPCSIRAYTDRQVLLARLVANEQRADANPLEKAHGYQKLVDDGCSIDEIALQAGKSESTVRQFLSLLKALEETQGGDRERRVAGIDGAVDLFGAEPRDERAVDSLCTRGRFQFARVQPRRQAV